MPYKSEKIKLPKQYDRRIKLTNQQRDEIKEKYVSGIQSQRALAQEYKNLIFLMIIMEYILYGLKMEVSQ